MMKMIIFLLAFIPLATVHAQKPALPKDRQVLFDFRVSDETSAPVKIAPATQRMVLSKLFRKYLTDANRCNFQGDAGDDYLAAARKAGQVVPFISDVETGSFTAPGLTQTLYVIDVSECNASHADNFGTKRVAIFAGQQLVADVDADFARNVIKKIDLNGDGVDELLMTTGDMAQGTLTEMATLVSFQNGRRKVIQDFGSVVEDSCASGFPGSTSEASVIYVSDGKITQENYSSGCQQRKRWRLVSRGKKE
jgi:hypothetical protein